MVEYSEFKWDVVMSREWRNVACSGTDYQQNDSDVYILCYKKKSGIRCAKLVHIFHAFFQISICCFYVLQIFVIVRKYLIIIFWNMVRIVKISIIFCIHKSVVRSSVTSQTVHILVPYLRSQWQRIRVINRMWNERTGESNQMHKAQVC